MGILKQEYTSYVKSRNNSDDIKRLMDEIYFKSRNNFSKVTTGESSLLFQNSILKNVFSNFEKFGEISSGIITFEPNHNYFVVHLELNLARYIFIFGFIITACLLSTVSFTVDMIAFSVTGFLMFFIFTIFCSQFTAYKFNSMIKDCIKNCGLGIE